MKPIRMLAFAALFCMVGALAAQAQETRKNAYITGKLAAIDAKELKVLSGEKEVTIKIPEKKIAYQVWEPGKLEDFKDGDPVRVYVQFKDDTQEIVSSSYFVRLPEGSRVTGKSAYNVSALLIRKGDDLAINVDGKDVPVKTTEKTNFRLMRTGTIEDAKVGYEVQCPAFEDGDAYELNNEVRIFPPAQ